MTHAYTGVLYRTTSLRYHITIGIGISTRIGIGAGKKYRVSEVSVNPGIGLSLVFNYSQSLQQLGM